MRLILRIFCFLTIFSTVADSAFSAVPVQIDFRDVGKNAIPAVVFIRIESHPKAVKQMEMLPPEIYNDPFWRHFFHSPHHRQETPSRPQMGLGSGFLISSDGYIMTNNHLIAGADQIKVSLQDKREFEAELIGSDPNTDLAILKISGDDFPYLEFGNSDTLEVGEWVVAIGAPLGLQATLTAGVVSAKGRSNLQITNFEDFIQTDAAINLGNSGGALVNLEGKVVGINTALASNTGGYMGIGFAIPSTMAVQVKDQLIDKGKVTRGFLGVGLQEVNQELADAFELEKIQGALITEVAPDSEAEKGGLQAGDLVITLNQKEIESISSLRNTLALMPPGTSFTFTLLRNGEKMEIDLKVGEHPQNKAAIASNSGKLGIEVETLTKDLKKEFSLGEEEGLIVTKVEKGSLAEKAGLVKGAIIIGVNMRPVKEPSLFYTQIEKGFKEKNRILLLVKQGYHTRFISIRS